MNAISGKVIFGEKHFQQEGNEDEKARRDGWVLRRVNGELRGNRGEAGVKKNHCWGQGTRWNGKV